MRKNEDENDVPLEITSIIRDLPIFATVKANSQFIESIARMMHLKYYQIGDHVIRQGEVARAMFFVVRGTVNVCSDDGEITFASLVHPCYCTYIFNFIMSVGEIALLFDIKRTANVVATSKCLVAVLTADDFKKCIQNYNQVGISIRSEAKKRFFALTKDLKSQGRTIVDEQATKLIAIKNVITISIFLN